MADPILDILENTYKRFAEITDNPFKASLKPLHEFYRTEEGKKKLQSELFEPLGFTDLDTKPVSIEYPTSMNTIMDCMKKGIPVVCTANVETRIVTIRAPE